MMENMEGIFSNTIEQDSIRIFRNFFDRGKAFSSIQTPFMDTVNDLLDFCFIFTACKATPGRDGIAYFSYQVGFTDIMQQITLQAVGSQNTKGIDSLVSTNVQVTYVGSHGKIRINDYAKYFHL